MAFNIMDLFGPGAVNRLLQPIQSASGVQNFLANPQAAASFDPARVAGGDRLPAVGMDALRERLTQTNPPVEVASAAQSDPWAGLREADVVKLDPTMTGATQAPQPATAQRSAQASPGSLFPSIDKAMLNDLFLGMAMGQTPQQSIALGAAQAAQGKRGRDDVNQTVEWLKGRGMDEGNARQLAANPSALSDYLKNMMAPEDPMKALQLEKAQLEVDNLRNPQAKLTDDQQEYEAAKAQGFEGSFMDYQIKMKEAGRSQINLDTGEKLPSGFRWKNPDDKRQGVEPIPGGPGEQIPGELAARVGMSESFQQQAPALRKELLSGDMTGPIDSTMAAWGFGDRGETYRQLQSGTDALMRLLTGAGMNATEAQAYAERYLPTRKDTPESAAGKLDQLVRELDAAKGMAMRGRGGAPSAAAPAANSGGVVDYRTYFGGQ